MAKKAPRTDERVLNYGTGPPDDGLEREWDTCPDCAQPRWQLILVPDVFYCDRCERSSKGPNREVREPEPEQIDLFGVTDETTALLDPMARATAERTRDVLDQAVEVGPPIDEGMAYLAEEMPDE